MAYFIWVWVWHLGAMESKVYYKVDVYRMVRVLIGVELSATDHFRASNEVG